jgi:hypothetical protein
LRARRDIAEKSQHVIGRLLGKLELRFTEARCYSTLDRYAQVRKPVAARIKGVHRYFSRRSLILTTVFCRPQSRSRYVRADVEEPAENVDPGRVPGHATWKLAPIEMAWQGKTLGEICRQMTDLGRNGGRTLDEVVHHMAEDSLVGWAWSPGAGREPAPGSQSAFGALIRAWAKSGAACPAR